VPPNEVTVIVPVPRFGVAGASTALVAMLAARKLPLHRETVPDAVVVRPADPLDAHAAAPKRAARIPNRAIMKGSR
jgi:hypothetical protein